MEKPAGSGKSKLYCNRCGSFDLMKLKRTFISKHIFDEPRKLHCQSCDAKLSFQLIASNRPLIPPGFYSDSDDTVLSSDNLGRPIYVTMDEYVRSAHQVKQPSKRHWFPFWTGVFSGLALFGIITGLFMLSPHSQARKITKTKAVYVQPITRLGDVEILRLDNTKRKNANIELILLDEPKKAPAEIVWEDVAARVERHTKRRAPVAAQSVNTIQRDLDRLLEN